MNRPDPKPVEPKPDAVPAAPLVPAPPPPPRRSECTAAKTPAAEQSAEFLRREEEAKQSGEDWARSNKRPSAMGATYDEAQDAHEFYQAQMAQLQHDLDGYLAQLARSDPPNHIPRSFNEAMLSEDLWMPAMELEMDMMRKRGVFSKVSRLEGKK
ncbi:hypothetical protein C0991_011999, partial [Blastosporella zonata]